ncbi:MAG: hypothetical protein KF849_14135 [Rhizobiaceae bacterium]|nr:hypothetical protein [Rhizobiaceae bacterium]
MSDVLFLPQSAPRPGLGAFAERLRRDEPWLYGLSVAMIAAMAPTVFAALADDRLFGGVDNWLKPFKFESALAVYLLTLVFFARFLPAGTTSRRWYRVYIGVVVAAVVYEMAWIAAAAALGTASHFNTTPQGIIFYSLAGLGAVTLTTPSAVYAVLIARNPASGLPPAMKEAIVLGLALVLPLTLVTAGTMSSMGSHFVGGTPLDPAGLPFFGWSREVGDLRVSHFFATHAMHAVPVLGLFAARLPQASGRLTVRLFAALYALFVAALFVQALMGQPVLGGWTA